MKQIRINITEEEYRILKGIAEELSESLTVDLKEKYTVTPNRIIQQFISDLTESKNSGGSDERDFANNWFSRSYYNF
ncbi:MAG: hypothetical protein ACI4MS_06440 [Candidatus Coproplasma sp.]